MLLSFIIGYTVYDLLYTSISLIQNE